MHHLVLAAIFDLVLIFNLGCASESDSKPEYEQLIPADMEVEERGLPAPTPPARP